jgi:hypothetical protein
VAAGRGSRVSGWVWRRHRYKYNRRHIWTSGFPGLAHTRETSPHGLVVQSSNNRDANMRRSARDEQMADRPTPSWAAVTTNGRRLLSPRGQRDRGPHQLRMRPQSSSRLPRGHPQATRLRLHLRRDDPHHGPGQTATRPSDPDRLPDRRSRRHHAPHTESTRPVRHTALANRPIRQTNARFVIKRFPVQVRRRA